MELKYADGIAESLLRGDTLITLAHKGTYLARKMLTYVLKNPN